MKFKNPGPIEFDAPIEPMGNGTGVCFPYDVSELYGVKNRVPVKVTFDGVGYQGSMVKMGGPHMLLLRKDIAAKVGKTAGDTVRVVVRLDDAPRTVELPDDVLTELANHPAARDYYDSLAFTHQREYVQWVTEAKKSETRIRRIEKMIDMLESGQKERS